MRATVFPTTDQGTTIVRHLLTALLLGALLNATAGAASSPPEKPTIRWLITDFPPQFILTGPHKGEGLAELAQRIATQRLDDYRHVQETVPANYPRIEQELKSRDDACFAAFLKTPERERAFAFSEAYRLMLPIELFVPADREQPPTRDGKVDLQALLRSGTFRLGVMGGRKYGPGIDDVLERFPDTATVYRRYAQDQLEGVLRMMAIEGRQIDGVLAYPNELEQRLALSGKALQPMHRYPIAGAPDYLEGYIACSQSPLGREAIARIDAILGQIRPAVSAAYAEQLRGEDREHYQALVKRVFGTLP